MPDPNCGGGAARAWPTALAFAPTRMNSGELLVGSDAQVGAVSQPSLSRSRVSPLRLCDMFFAQIWRLRVDADARAPRGALEPWERDREVGHKLAVTTVVVQVPHAPFLLALSSTCS